MNITRNFLPLMAALCLAALPVALLPGCAGTPQRTAFNTIATLEHSTMASYDGYLASVIRGDLPTNDVPRVSQAFNVFQDSILVALDGVQFNTNALAPPNLVIASQDLLNLIKQIRTLNTPERTK